MQQSRSQHLGLTHATEPPARDRTMGEDWFVGLAPGAPGPTEVRGARLPAEARRARTAPVAVAHKATWSGEALVPRGSLVEVAGRRRKAGVDCQAPLLVSLGLGARSRPATRFSELCDAASARHARP